METVNEPTKCSQFQEIMSHARDSITSFHNPSQSITIYDNFNYRMRIFATDRVVAKSRFWYYLNRLKKVKKAVGEIVACQKVYEKKPTTVKNFGIWIRYDSRSGESFPLICITYSCN